MSTRKSTRSSIVVTKQNDNLIETFQNIVLYRDYELNLLNDLLIKSNKCLYPLIHLYGLSGTGKTFFIRNFLNIFTTNTNNSVKYYPIYLNLIEICYQSVQHEILFNEILIQLCKHLNIDDMDDYLLPNSNDLTMFLRNLNKILKDFSNSENINLLIIIDHADNLKYLNSTNEQNHIFLLLCKLNEYLSEFLSDCKINLTTCTIFISEIEWHSLISECNLMSQTETSRPIQILFQNYTKDQMFNILTRDDDDDEENDDDDNKLMYIRIILDVFFTICKDLNELNYLIETYYQQLKSASSESTINLWNKIKPYLKQALTRIYLRESFTIDNLNEVDNSKNLTKEFECLNIDTNKILIRAAAASNPIVSQTKITIELPLLVKYILIAAYIGTHNSVKYDRKLFDYHTAKTYRKQKFNANAFQKIDETRRVASIKLHQFDLNRLLAIFYTIIMDNTQINIKKRFEDLNLSILQCEIETLKNLNYIQQCNGSFSNLDEPKFKCLIDFDTISLIASSVNFSIKQYLAEYFLSA
jgi:hypothetical protein